MVLGMRCKVSSLSSQTHRWGALPSTWSPPKAHVLYTNEPQILLHDTIPS